MRIPSRSVLHNRFILHSSVPFPVDFTASFARGNVSISHCFFFCCVVLSAVGVDRQNMASALLLVSSLMVGVVPNALVVLLLLLKFPQLLLIALVSAAVYYFGPVMSSSLWFWMLGTKDSSDASFFFVVWCSVATEASRYAVCTWVLRAESEFRRHHQTLKYTRAPHNKLVPLALAVGAGFAMMQSTIAAGLVANAEVMLTWRDQGTETGAWMTEGADVVSWFDITSCPQMPKIAVVAVQCLLLSVCQ